MEKQVGREGKVGGGERMKELGKMEKLKLKEEIEVAEKKELS